MCKALYEDKIGNGCIGISSDNLTRQKEKDVEGGYIWIKNRAYYQYWVHFKVH